MRPSSLSGVLRCDIRFLDVSSASGLFDRLQSDSEGAGWIM